MTPPTAAIERVAQEAVSGLKLTPYPTGGNRLKKGLAVVALMEHRSEDEIARHFALSETAATLGTLGVTPERLAEDPALKADVLAAVRRGVGRAVDQARPVHQQTAAEVVSLDGLDEATPDPSPPVAQAAVRRRLIEGVIEAAKLTERQHEALRLRLYDGLEFHEAAARMGVETTSATTSYYQAVKRLRRAADALGLNREALRFFDEFPDKL